jgi:hypothetical protein
VRSASIIPVVRTFNTEGCPSPHMVRNRRRPRHIFIGLTEIAGYYGQLAEGFRSCGIQVTFVDLSDNPFRYGGNSAHPIARMAAMASATRARAIRRGGPRAVAARIAFRLALAALFVSVVARHDTFIFGFGSSFFWLRELRLLRFLGKTIVFVFNGSDARPPYIDGALMDPALGRSVDSCVDLTARRRREIHLIERSAHLVVSHALYLHFFERPAAGFQVLGLPGPGPDSAPPEPELASDPIRILHSPSQPGAKGTSRIRSTIERLQAEGMNLDLVELQGVPNSVVHRELRRCHFVIDQLYSDGPMLSFAREAAQYGRPAVVGSYGWEEIRRLMPAGSIAPVEACHPDDLESAIRKLADDPVHRRQLGRAAHRFLRGWTSALVARRYLRLLRGERPAAWMCDPSTVGYVHGVGLSEERARKIVAAVIRRAGVSALQVRDKPELEQAFVALARHDPTGDPDRPTVAPAETV